MIKDYKGRVWMQEEIQEIEKGYILIYRYRKLKVSLKFRESSAISNDVIRGRLDMKIKSLGI